jgi:hypothetical protein
MHKILNNEGPRLKKLSVHNMYVYIFIYASTYLSIYVYNNI